MALTSVGDDFHLLGFLNAFKEPLAASQSCERMCNELVADLTGLDIEAKPQEGTLLHYSRKPEAQMRTNHT